MKVIVARDLVKYHGGEVKVLSGASLAVESGEKVGLVGRNGAGKTTLLNILGGREEPDAGSVELVGGAVVGMTPQQLYAGERGRRPVEEEMLSAFEPLIRREEELAELERLISEDPSEALLERYGRLQAEFERDGGYEYRARAASALSSLGFEPADWKRPAGSFSGGEQSRIALARLLLSEPDLILLDEPTNHLDLGAIEWLEGFIKNTRSAVLVVSHDRYFLDNVVTSILELEDGRITRYTGGYSEYVAQKRARTEQLARKARANEERRAQLERFIEKNRSKARKASQAKSKQKLLERMEKIEVPSTRQKKVHLDLGGERVRAGRVVLEMEDVRYRHEDEQEMLLEEIDLVVERGERVALLGPNGTGKSTIMRLASGELEPLSGTVRLGHNVIPAYQDQQLARLDPGKTVLDELRDATGLDPADARDLLGAFLFSGDDVFRKVAVLSGGQKSLLSLAEIVASDANFLLLDEPTNDLDIPAREALEEALLDYRGTILFVSHDRYFLRRIATRIVELEGRTLRSYPGGYGYYLSHRRLDAKDSSKKTRRRLRPGMDRKQNVLATRLVAVEGEIDATERRINRLEKELATSELYADGERSRRLVTEHRQLKSTLEGLYADWEELMVEAEEAGI
ncbi:ABC-F family ATP-binding cassette domain-containing protein [Rubrobacter calidifluminis]|uniref:ABC-F family ATP-binding cassette domain-containing protein n=1 Tax=Rubrobacter calidifluminis TaxID=1392640 RepID=UPI00235E02FB|nr:ABC-F family ATP-binding cassette domain-containing protein [Rubrobacter calidifluminis]